MNSASSWDGFKEKGHLEVITGPMFAGKTTELLQRIATTKNPEFLVVFKPVIDQRYSSRSISSHTGKLHSAYYLNETTFQENLKEGIPLHICVDEVQFFDESILFWCKQWLALNYRITLAGLLEDSEGKAFGYLSELIALAHQHTQLSTACAVCGAEAIHTQRLSNHSSRIAIGGSESYEPRCTSCFKPAHFLAT